jgi:cysteinyl-tRNA synthetase
MIKLYNTKNKKVEDFRPIDANSVSVYTCGPTVYDYAHIGNLRTYIFEDLLERTLTFAGFSINRVMNITDIDDKIIKKSAGRKSLQKEITEKFESIFFDDLKSLNILKPKKITRATEYISQMVDFVKALLNRGFAYRGEDQSIYFSIDKFDNYGKLSGLEQADLKSGARVKQDEYEKENPADFVLWKAWDKSDGEIYYDTEIGRGRPGWHLECSAMAEDQLGKTIDIHAGAVDLIFPHHENEIAQSEAKNDQPFAKFWLHGEHLLVDGRKMSKSLNNFHTLSDLKKRDFSPLDFRYLVLTTHYRSKLNFTWKSLEASKNALNNLRQNINRISSLPDLDQNTLDQVVGDFKTAIFNDLKSPVALSILQNLVNKAISSGRGGKKATDLISAFDSVLGLKLVGKIDIPKRIIELAKQRDQAKKSGDYRTADKRRGEIQKAGFLIEDQKDGYKIIPT